MSFDILLPEDQLQMPVLDTAAVSQIVAAGIKTGSITSLHSCVEYVNSQIEPNLGGNEVQGVFDAVVEEARRMNSEADAMARTGATVTTMGTAITGTYFTFDDIKNFKVELYGSTAAWKAAMQDGVA